METNENEIATAQHLGCSKSGLNTIPAIQVYIQQKTKQNKKKTQKTEMSQIHSLTLHLKEVEKE